MPTPCARKYMPLGFLLRSLDACDCQKAWYRSPKWVQMLAMGKESRIEIDRTYIWTYQKIIFSKARGQKWYPLQGHVLRTPHYCKGSFPSNCHPRQSPGKMRESARSNCVLREKVLAPSHLAGFSGVACGVRFGSDDVLFPRNVWSAWHRQMKCNGFRNTSVLTKEFPWSWPGFSQNLPWHW